MTYKYVIRGPRQRRVLEHLLASPSGIPCKDLGVPVGAANPADVIMKLRQQGFAHVIITERFEMKDRDGRKCRPGRYRIVEKFREEAQRALQKNTNDLITPKPASIKPPQTGPKSTTGGPTCQ